MIQWQFWKTKREQNKLKKEEEKPHDNQIRFIVDIFEFPRIIVCACACDQISLFILGQMCSCCWNNLVIIIRQNKVLVNTKKEYQVKLHTKQLLNALENATKKNNKKNQRTQLLTHVTNLNWMISLAPDMTRIFQKKNKNQQPDFEIFINNK